MKRERLYCLLLAIIGAILLFVLTIKFIPSPFTVSMLLVYFLFTSVISISGLGIIKNRKSKENWFGLSAGLDGCVMIVIFIIGLFGEIDESIRNIIPIIFVITFLLFVILCGLWSKFEKTSIS